MRLGLRIIDKRKHQQEGCGHMLTIKKNKAEEKKLSAHNLELYRLIEDCYTAMQEGRKSTVEVVEERIQQRRAGRG